MTIHAATLSVTERPNRISGGIIMSACVRISRRRFGTESATRPPQAPTRRIGRNWRAEVTPTASAEPVSVRTSHISATICIQLPLIETSCPPNQRR